MWLLPATGSGVSMMKMMNKDMHSNSNASIFTFYMEYGLLDYVKRQHPDFLNICEKFYFLKELLLILKKKKSSDYYQLEEGEIDVRLPSFKGCFLQRMSRKRHPWGSPNPTLSHPRPTTTKVPLTPDPLTQLWTRWLIQDLEEVALMVYPWPRIPVTRFWL